MALLLGVDLGTTAIKAGLYDLSGRLVASASVEQELSTPEPDAVELDVEAYWRGFVSAVRAVLDAAPDKDAVAGVALSVQGETLVAVDERGKAIRPAVVWLDSRAKQESEQLAERFGNDVVFEITGQTEMLPTWPAPKILWLRRHEPDTFAKTAQWMLLEDYFILRLTGESRCEGSLTTSTCYWNFRTRSWWNEMLEVLGIGAQSLPAIGESGTPVGTLRAVVAEELGLSTQTVVSLGALDQACGAIGVGNVVPGVFSENTGAALAICSTVAGPILDPRRRIPCHYHGLPGQYMLHTFTSGGIVLRWWRDAFAHVSGDEGSDGYEQLTTQAAAVPAGADGVIVVPHLQGAMAPDPNPYASAAIVGLRLSHGPAQVVRAVLESIAYVVRRNVEAIEALGIAVDEIRALGGGAKSALWKQIESSVTGLPVIVTTCPEPATLGAALLAGVGAGLYEDVASAVASAIHVARRFEPDEAEQSHYDGCYARYVEVTETLGDLALRHRELAHAG